MGELAKKKADFREFTKLTSKELSQVYGYKLKLIKLLKQLGKYSEFDDPLLEEIARIHVYKLKLDRLEPAKISEMKKIVDAQASLSRELTRVIETLALSRAKRLGTNQQTEKNELEKIVERLMKGGSG